jgi:nitrate/nitrite-specific signal transduction histidine kinase
VKDEWLNLSSSLLCSMLSCVTHGNFDFEMKRDSGPDEIGQLSTQFDSVRQMLNQRTGELE